jgi:hypothetical protein
MKTIALILSLLLLTSCSNPETSGGGRYQEVLMTAMNSLMGHARVRMSIRTLMITAAGGYTTGVKTSTSSSPINHWLARTWMVRT